MHQKRLSAPRTYPMRVKSVGRFVAVPRPGPHPKKQSIPLSIIIKDILKYSENGREAKKIIKSGKIMVDGKTRRDHKYPVGIFDVIQIPETKESFRVVPGEKWLNLIKIPQKENNTKICRIENKTCVKGGKIQLNLNDGKNILVKKDSYKTNDSVLIEVPNLNIKKHLSRKEGSLCLITRGRNKGKMGKIKKLKKTEGSRPNLVSVELNQKIIDLPEDCIFVIGEKEPIIKISE